MSKGAYREQELAKQHGDLERVIPEHLKKFNGSQKEVAEKLGATQAFVSRWLQRHGYRKQVIWVKDPESEPAA